MMLSKTKILSIYFLFLNVRMNPTGSFASKWNKSFLPRKSIGCKLFKSLKICSLTLGICICGSLEDGHMELAAGVVRRAVVSLLLHNFYTIFTTRTDLHCRCCPQLLYFASCLKKSHYI